MHDVVAVSTNLVYLDELISTEERIFDAPIADMEGGLPLTERTLRASAQGNQTAFEPGAIPQMAVIPTYPGGGVGEMRATQDERETSFALNEVFRVMHSIPNSYIRDRSSITVNLFDFEIHCQESMQNQNGGNFTQYDWYEHQRNTPRALITEDEEAMQASIRLVSTATGIPVENISVERWRVPHFVDYYPEPRPWHQIIPFIILALLLLLLAIVAIKRTQPDEEDEIEPELSVEDLLVSTQMEEALEDEQLEPIGYEESNEAKLKIDAFIEEKPEAAASLLRHWLNETEF
jgi:flagellar M-ring protein FliF